MSLENRFRIRPEKIVIKALQKRINSLIKRVGNRGECLWFCIEKLCFYVAMSRNSSKFIEPKNHLDFWAGQSPARSMADVQIKLQFSFSSENRRKPLESRKKMDFERKNPTYRGNYYRRSKLEPWLRHWTFCCEDYAKQQGKVCRRLKYEPTWRLTDQM